MSRVAENSSQQEPVSERLTLAVLSYTAAIYALFFNIQPVLVGVLQKTFDFDGQQLGEVLSAGFFSSCLVLGSTYFWVGRVRRRPAIATGIAVALAGLVAAFFASDYLPVVLAMVLLGGGLAITAAPVVLAMGALPNPTRAFGYGISAMVLLAGVCALLIPVVLYPTWGYGGVMVFLMLLVVVVLFLLPLIPDTGRPQSGPQSDPHSGSPTGATQPTATKRSTLGWLALAATVVYFLGLNSNWAFFELIGGHAGITTEAIGVSLSAGLVMGAAGSLTATVFHSRLSVTFAMGVAVSGFTVYVLMISGAASAWRFAAAVLLFNIVWNFSLPYTMEMVRAHDPSGRLLGLVPAAQALGGALGPLLAGSLLLVAGPGALYVQLMVCIVLMAAVFIWLERRLHPAA